MQIPPHRNFSQTAKTNAVLFVDRVQDQMCVMEDRGQIWVHQDL